MHFKVGCDPELFVGKDGRFISAHDIIPGTKMEPYQVNMGAIQRDGVAAEFNIVPADNCNEFLDNIHIVLDQLKKFIPSDYELIAQPTAWFDQGYFDSLPDDPKTLGCTPDYNAYTGGTNNPPSTNLPFRTGSFHVHVGWTEYQDIYDDDYMRLCCDFVKQLDQALYYPSLSWDSDKERRKLYGAMGAFRPKSYGCEYRVLSNAALRDDSIVRFVYDRTIWAADLFFNKGVKLYEDAPVLPEKYR